MVPDEGSRSGPVLVHWLGSFKSCSVKIKEWPGKRMDGKGEAEVQTCDSDTSMAMIFLTTEVPRKYHSP